MVPAVLPLSDLAPNISPGPNPLLSRPQLSDHGGRNGDQSLGGRLSLLPPQLLRTAAKNKAHADVRPFECRCRRFAKSLEEVRYQKYFWRRENAYADFGKRETPFSAS
jgi:hypothetical protein